MKKVLTVTALIFAMTFAGIQTASAHGGRNYTNNNDYCGAYGTYDRTYTELWLSRNSELRPIQHVKK